MLKDSATMTKALLIAAAGALLTVLPAAPAAAQPRNESALIIFGNDPCPAGNICVRAPESQRYRIPENLRRTPDRPGEELWANRAAAIDAESASVSRPGGIGSCNAGAGQASWTGCWSQMMKDARAERAQAGVTDRDVP